MNTSNVDDEKIQYLVKYYIDHNGSLKDLGIQVDKQYLDETNNTSQIAQMNKYLIALGA